MADNRNICRNICVGEANKLEGVANYLAWQIKMTALFRRERLWDVTTQVANPAIFPAQVGGERLSENQLRDKKLTAMSAIVLSVKDNLFGLVAGFQDPALAWATLKNTYERGGALQILLATSQMYSLKMFEGGVMEEYLNIVRDLKN